MGCLRTGMWEKTQGGLEVETSQGRKLRGGIEGTEKGKESGRSGKNTRKMLYSG